MPESRLHQLLTRAEEALLARTLQGRHLERDVHGPDGNVLFEQGREIDHALLDAAREHGLLEEVAHAAEPGTSDTDLADFLWWRRRQQDADRPPGPRDPSDHGDL